MPNHCENNLSVYAGDKEAEKELEELKKKARVLDGEKWSLFNSTVPMPEELLKVQAGCNSLLYEGDKSKLTPEEKDMLKKYGSINWYDWNVKEWGTKWDAYGVVEEDNHKTSWQLLFMTAWSPPIAWLEKVAKQYPNLHFRLKYVEMDMSFMGKAEGQGTIVNKLIE